MRSRMNYYKLIIASSYLRYVPGVRFVATNPDKTLPIHDGLVSVCEDAMGRACVCSRAVDRAPCSHASALLA
jgi:hypothetical protein